jgi:hypothetical protein
MQVLFIFILLRVMFKAQYNPHLSTNPAEALILSVAHNEGQKSKKDVNPALILIWPLTWYWKLKKREKRSHKHRNTFWHAFCVMLSS